MIETITPAGCGGRNRYRIALASFTLGAVTAAAVVGALLGLAGALLGTRHAVIAAAALAALAAAREAGLVRVPLPQLRLQVPERWHFELPLPVWTTGYGAGLGVGFATYHPVATFWVACAVALALGRPLAAALCFSLYGLGRALMVILPRRPEGDVTAVVETLVRRRSALGRANAVALAVCAVLLAAAPAAQAAPVPLGAGSQLDPAVTAGAFAYTQRDGDAYSVVVLSGGTQVFRAPGRTPSLDGPLLAYDDGTGIRIVNWQDPSVPPRLIPGPHSKPALEAPWVAYRSDLPDGRIRLRLRNLNTGAVLTLSRALPGSDVGRPSIEAGRVAWHKADARGSRVVTYRIATATATVLARSRRWLHGHPALSATRVVWVEQRSGVSYVRLRRFGSTTTATLAKLTGRNRFFWTTALRGRTAHVTRWELSTGAAVIYSVRF